MILQRLAEYAQRQEDSLPSGFQRDLIQKEIRLRADGTLRDVLRLGGETRGQRSGKVQVVPRIVRAASIKPILIDDNAKYAFNVIAEGDKADRAAECHEAYVRLVERCATSTADDRVAAYARFLRTPEVELVKEKLEPGDNVVVSVDGQLLTEIPAVRAFWSEPKEGTVATCLVTGLETKVEDRMPVPIKGIPGGQTSGMQLVSVNFDAAESYGLKYALNSPISRSAAEAFSNGLNALIQGEETKVRIGNTLYLFWSRHGGNPLSSLFKDPQPEAVQALMHTVHQGRQHSHIEESDFYMLAVSPYGPRVVIRDFIETSLETAQKNLAEWFSKTTIRDYDGALRTFGYGRLLGSLFRKADEAPEHVGTAIVRSAILGERLPSSFVALAVRRNQAMQGPFAEYQNRRYIDLPRLALLQATLGISSNSNPMEQFTSEIDRQAYACGRLLAALDRIQYLSLGSVNATLTDRYYGAASTSPRTVFPPLIKTAQAHIAKVRRDKGTNLHPRLEEILQPIGAFPAKLAVSQQGLFALGFYHERARRKPSEESAPDVADNESQPEK